MRNYLTKTQTITINAHTLKITTLKDRQQYDEEAAIKDGISDALWPISGVIWPSSIILAVHMDHLNLTDKKVLDIGCGVAIPSLLAAVKGAIVTATDFNTVAKELLEDNCKANGLEPIRFEQASWNTPISLGSFDLIVGADLLYEEEHFKILAAFINMQAHASSTVIIVDHGRGYAKKFATLMEQYHWACDVEMLPKQTVLGEAYNKGRIMTFTKVH